MQELALRDSVLDMQPSTWSMLKDQAAYLVRSGLLPQAINTPEKAAVVMLKGREIGLPPMLAFAHIHVINGKPTISAELMMSLIYRHCPKAKIEYLTLSDKVCSIRATRPGHASIIVTFSIQDAEKARLLTKDVWKQYPRAMLRARAISEMARAIFPDALMGCSYTPEEMGAEVNEEGDILEVATARAEETRASAVEPEVLDEPVKAKPKLGYDGSQKQAEILKTALTHKKVPEELWGAIDDSMLGKNFHKLDAVIEEVKKAAEIHA